MFETIRNVSVGFTKETFPAGTHICLIYNEEKERRRVISKFLESGLLSGEKVAYFADTISPPDMREWLESMDIGFPSEDNPARFGISSATETYCPDNVFVPEKMSDTLRDFYRQSMKEGYPGCRVSGEMSWSLRGIPGSERLIEYESLVNEVLVTHPVTAICQYDANLFSGATIFDVLKVHPMMIVQGQIVRNPYYVKPGDFAKEVNDT